MALKPLALNYKSHYLYPSFTSYQKPSPISNETTPQKIHHSNINRRVVLIALPASSIILAQEAIWGDQIASAFNFNIMAPDQSMEDTGRVIKDHAQSLLAIKALLEAEEWSKAQDVLRTSSSNLKRDIYTLILLKPASERPQLRALYTNLFNSVTKVSTIFLLQSFMFK